MTPPKPEPRADRASLFTHLRLFRRDILSAQPARLYRALMAEFRTPFFESYLCNDPALVRLVLDERPADFPKSGRLTEGLTPLLGRSVFVTNGAEWMHQRRIIDPAFEGGRLREAFPAIWAAGEAAVARMGVGEQEMELAASHAAADVIFRTLFSIPIEDRVAQAVFQEFRAYQRSAPILNLAAFLPLPNWMPRPHRRATRRSAAAIRGLIAGLTENRAKDLGAGEGGRRGFGVAAGIRNHGHPALYPRCVSRGVAAVSAGADDGPRDDPARGVSWAGGATGRTGCHQPMAPAPA